MNRTPMNLLGLIVTIAILLSACAPVATVAPSPEPQEVVQPTSVPPTEVPVPKPENPEVILATTTSTRDTGLLDELLPMFLEKTGYNVKMVAVGTGEALKMGQEGNADVLLVHAPASEEAFMKEGYGSDRRLVMHNDFIIVGPADDPAGIKSLKTTVEALSAIATSGDTFVSRADDSGTHKMELKLWKTAEITPEGDWYLETGQGMADTLRIASEKGAYTLTDRGTYLAQKDTLHLDILFEGDAALLNIYHVIVVNHEKWPSTNQEGAVAFAEFLTSPETQEFVRTFGVDKYGQPLFFPDAGKAEDEVGQ